MSLRDAGEWGYITKSGRFVNGAEIDEIVAKFAPRAARQPAAEPAVLGGLAAKIAERLMRHGIPLAVWEPSGKAHGLRPDEAEWLAADISDIARSLIESTETAGDER